MKGDLNLDSIFKYNAFLKGRKDEAVLMVTWVM